MNYYDVELEAEIMAENYELSVAEFEPEEINPWLAEEAESAFRDLLAHLGEANGY